MERHVPDHGVENVAGRRAGQSGAWLCCLPSAVLRSPWAREGGCESEANRQTQFDLNLDGAMPLEVPPADGPLVGRHVSGLQRARICRGHWA